MRSPTTRDGKQDPVPSYDATFRQCREIISGLVPAIADQYAAATGLPLSSSQFQENVIRTLVCSVALHLDAPKRKRFSDLRKEMLRVEKAAAAAEKGLRGLQAALDQLTPMHRDAILKDLETPRRTAFKLEGLSVLAGMYAGAFADKGGPLAKMAEFAMLVRGLARAFESATGRAAKVTWNQYDKKYEGHFVDLVETMLPLALTCAKSIGWQMSCPGSKRARGKYIYEMTRSGRAMSPTPYHIS
jgi:hypothetical protein